MRIYALEGERGSGDANDDGAQDRRLSPRFDGNPLSSGSSEHRDRIPVGRGQPDRLPEFPADAYYSHDFAGALRSVKHELAQLRRILLLAGHVDRPQRLTDAEISLGNIARSKQFATLSR